MFWRTTVEHLYPVLFFLIIAAGCSRGSVHTSSESLFSVERRLIITADDFGAAECINEGICLAAGREAITEISALANFPGSMPELKKIAERQPEIGIGVHLNIVTGKPVLPPDQVPSLVDPTGKFFPVEELLPRLRRIEATDLREELRAQILALESAGIRPDHLSDHTGILSLYSPFHEIIAGLAEEYHLPIRSPLIAGREYPDLFPGSCMMKHGRQLARRLAFAHPFKALRLLPYAGKHETVKKVAMLDQMEIPYPDLLVEYFYGDPTSANFQYILEHLPAGTSEIVLHLGVHPGEESYPSGLDLPYLLSREKELGTITGKDWKENFRLLNIRTIAYSKIKDQTTRPSQADRH